MSKQESAFTLGQAREPAAQTGKTYKTRGGWDAVVIWGVSRNTVYPKRGFYAIHKPHTEEESVPIFHWDRGEAHATFSVNDPPTYDVGYPADIILEETVFLPSLREILYKLDQIADGHCTCIDAPPYNECRKCKAAYAINGAWEILRDVWQELQGEKGERPT